MTESEFIRFSSIMAAHKVDAERKRKWEEFWAERDMVICPEENCNRAGGHLGKHLNRDSGKDVTW